MFRLKINQKISLRAATVSGFVGSIFFGVLLYASPVAAASLTWIGPQSGAWDNPTYWSGGKAPTVDDDVIVVSSANNISVSVPAGKIANFKSLTIGGDAAKYATVTFSGNIGSGNTITILSKGVLNQANNARQTIIGSMKIMNGGTFTHSPNSSKITSAINFTMGDLLIETGGKIYANGRGYAAGPIRGKGYGPGPGVFDTLVGSGGAYGGNGSPSNLGTLAGGTAYGSPDSPELDAGSSGGGSGNSAGGAGGGIIQLVILETLVNNGTISADGNPGRNSCGGSPSAPSGAGAGGGIRIEAKKITGTGKISANGGIGGNDTIKCSGGNGGGGRILVSGDTTEYSGTITVSGGKSISAAKVGEDGTVQKKQPPAPVVEPEPTPAVEIETAPAVSVPIPEPAPALVAGMTDSERAKIPGVLNLFFRDVGQRIKLFMTLDPVLDAQKRIEFAQSNLEFADKIFKATTDLTVQERAVNLVSRAQDLVTTANKNHERWAAGDTSSVSELVLQAGSYFQTAESLIVSIGTNIVPEYKQQLEEIVTGLQNQNTELSAFIQTTYAVQAKTPEKKEPVIVNPRVIIKDQDRDGLDDAQEIELGIKPVDFDTDGDGLSDKAEIEKYGTDPSKDDTDGDGFRDGLEILKGYNPNGNGLLITTIPDPGQFKFLNNLKTKPGLSPETAQYINNIINSFSAQ